MQKTININELHSLLLEEAKIIHRILCDNDVPYYMLGGTMLGAIRHSGFIPWDDDMDFGIKRVDFAKAYDVLKNNLPKQYRIRTLLNSDSICSEILKIENTNTIIEEKGITSPNSQIGINIDIFPLDETNNQFHFPHTLFFLQKLHKLNYEVLIRKSGLLYTLGSVFTKRFGRDFYCRIIKKILTKQKGDYISNFYGAWLQRETVSKEVMGQPVLYNFEDTQLYGVSRPHDYLSSLYGDYMVLPSEGQRHLHILNMYYREDLYEE